MGSKTRARYEDFLQPFVDQANELATKGFTWKCHTNYVTSKFFPIGCCVDSPARSSMLNMKRFNGFYGCTYCEHPTTLIESIRKYPMLCDPPPLRTHNRIIQYMIEASENNGYDIMGVWGPSPLMYLKNFDLVNGMVLDFMHSCLLGVTELYTKILMSNVKNDYYIGSPSNILLINERLLSIKPPSCVANMPRDIKERNQWKASQWFSWLYFYSLICYRGMLPLKYYNHWALFVSAMHKLLEDSITPKMLQDAGILLVKFVYYFEKLYGEQYMHYNVHLLLHLKDTVENWGPLWANNTFSFENQNRLLLKNKKCDNRIAQQIVYRLLIYQQLPLLERQNYISSNTRNICYNLYNKNRLKNFEKFEECNLLRRGKHYELLNEEQLYVARHLNIINIKKCFVYSKIIYNGCRFTSYLYDRSIKTDDSVFQSITGDFGIITKICKIEYDDNKKKLIVFYNKIELKNNYIVDNADVCVQNLQHCKISSTNDLNIISYDHIYKPCILMNAGSKLYISRLVKATIGKCIN